MTKQRNDITFQYDVFISWTKKDEVLKNRIEKYLTDNGINCLVSDLECSGDFEEWSVAATQKCNVFLLVYTENTLRSKYVPLEIAEFLTVPDCYNRILPVCTDLSLYRRDTWGLQDRVSACFMDQEDYLARMLHSVQNLLINHLHYVYREAVRPEYIELIPFLKDMPIGNKKFDFSKLYIPRTLTQVDNNQNTLKEQVKLTAEDIGDDILFISGSAGSGKSRYLQQLQQELPWNILPLVVPCRRISASKSTVTEELFQIFHNACGLRSFYTRRHFESLLTSGIRVLLILDGMDEIPNELETNQFVDKIQAWVHAAGDDCNLTLLFTSRNPNDVRRIAIGGREILRYRLDPFTEEDIRQLSQNLFVLFNTPSKKDDFYLQLADLDQEIRTNPFLLSQLAIVYQAQGKLPQTAVDIYDAIFSICLEQDLYAKVPVPSLLAEKLKYGGLSTVLKNFSRMRYESLSQGEHEAAYDIFCCVLEDDFDDNTPYAAEALVEYLQNRAIMVEDEFYHKMFLEYFTAVSFYDNAFGYSKKIKNPDVIAELFRHYCDPYWSSVIKLFLVKADSLLNSHVTQELYRFVLEYCQDDFTLLLDTCRELLRHKFPAQNVLTDYILQRSADGSYPAYGPLFWYVPEYNLYENAVTALLAHTDAPDFSKMLALTRDVCFIFGQKNTVTEILPQVDGVSLWKKTKLTGVRGALCEIFCTGDTAFAGGEDIYPRCFNVAEAKAFLQSDCGITGRMQTPFADELGLYSHDFVPVMGDYNIGFAALPYDIPYLEKTLNSHSCRKLRGLALSPTEAEQMEYMSFNSSHLEVCYLPENVFLPEYTFLPDDPTLPDDRWQKSMPLRQFVFETNYVLHYIRYGLRGLKTIEHHQFAGCLGFTDLIIPDSVVSIRFNAFQQCRNLRSVVFTSPNTYIETDAFYNTGLQSITFAEGMDHIGGFDQCHNLTSVTLPSSVTTIQAYAFTDCIALESVVLPDGLTSIGDKAFSGCQKLQSIAFTNPNTEIGDDAFCNTGLQSITFAEGMDYIGGFSACHALTSITLPSSVTAITSSAFAQCTSLESVTFPEGLTDIGYAAFAGCSKLTEITIPSSVINLHPNAFADCSCLQQINLSEGLRSIFHNCFAGCEALTQIHLPETVDLIAMDAFWGCVNLQSIHIPSGVSAINSNTFRNCRSLTQIHLPEGLICIGKKAFYQCSSLHTVNIPNSVTEIGDEAFGCCPCLTALNLPAHLEDDRDWYTQSMEEKDEVAVEDSSPCHTLWISLHSSSSAELGEILILSDPVITKEDVQGRLQNVDQLIIGQGFTELGSHVFENLPTLVKVHLPDSLKHIGAFAFYSDEALQSVRLPEGLDCIENSAFSGCFGLQDFEIPTTVTYIGEGAFQMVSTPPPAIRLPAGLTHIKAFTFGLSNFREITIPEGVSTIEEFAFWGCSQLTCVHMPTKMDTIESSAFYQCSSLQAILLPDGLNNIPSNCFNSCTSLTQITVPEGVAEIGNFAFENCTQLTSVTLPNSLRAVDSGAFSGCKNITEVTIGRRFEDSLSDIFPDAKLEKVTFI